MQTVPIRVSQICLFTTIGLIAFQLVAADSTATAAPMLYVSVARPRKVATATSTNSRRTARNRHSFRVSLIHKD